MKIVDGVQRMPSQIMLIWYISYFELRTHEKHQMLEGPSDFSFAPWK
jgi:hypothetical protein